jgi:rsbT co-antagonist protein RsbR
VSSRIAEILQSYEAELLSEWIRAQLSSVRRKELVREAELRDQSAEFLRLLTRTVRDAGAVDLSSSESKELRDVLTRISKGRGLQGFTPSETASFIFSFKQPLFGVLRRELAKTPDALADELWRATVLLDALGLFTTEVQQQTREEVISRQQAEMLELSTPVVELWEGVLALPLIGTLDSSRTQTVMESLLQRIVDTGSEIAIIDITGVPTVDTLTAQHLLKTVTATRLMGADCIISGIRPQIAQTIVHLGVDLAHVSTKYTLAGAFALALQRMNKMVVKAPSGSSPHPSAVKS